MRLLTTALLFVCLTARAAAQDATPAPDVFAPDGAYPAAPGGLPTYTLRADGSLRLRVDWNLTGGQIVRQTVTVLAFDHPAGPGQHGTSRDAFREEGGAGSTFTVDGHATMPVYVPADQLTNPTDTYMVVVSTTVCINGGVYTYTSAFPEFRVAGP